MKRRASILILAIFFIFVVQLLAFGFARLIPVEMMSAGRTRLDVGAALAAEAGLEYTVAWMENELKQGREPTDAARPEVRLSRPVEGWTWTVTARPDSQTPPNGISNQRVYMMTAEASQRAGERIYARMRSTVMQESFAAYTRFVDQWPPTSWAAAGPAQIRGRFHTNDTFRMMIYGGFFDGPHPDYWPEGPTFWGKVTAHGRADTPDGVEYRPGGEYDPPPFGPDGKPIKSRYDKLFKGGRSSLQTGVARIEMPLNATVVSLAHSAWGGDPTPPQANRLYFNEGGGIYVSGPISSLELQAPAGLSRQRFGLAGGPVEVVEVREGSFVTPAGTSVPAGSTAVLGPGSDERVVASLPNGVIYAEGRISDLTGTNRGPHTIATPADIWMAEHGDLFQVDALPPADYNGGELATQAGNSLGLVCRHLQVPAFEHLGDNLYLYAAIVCSNGGDGNLIVNDWNLAANHTAKLVLVGSLVEDARTYWASTEVAAGYAAVLQHDPNLLTSPPPNFPCTSRLHLRQAVYDVL